MSTYVLVHGAWFGAWCWDKLTPLLEQGGHKVLLLDLPGHGADHTPTTEITLDSYVARVGETLAAQTEPVILVGHSMGGITLSQAAEAYPDKIKALIYVAAYLIQDGHTGFEAAGGDADAKLGPFLRPDVPNGVIGLADGAIAEAFLHDASANDIERARSLSRPEPLTPPNTPLHLTDARFGAIPRIYIKTLNDRVVSPALQDQMIAALPCQALLEIATGHSPFVAAPEQLAQLLSSI